MYRLAKLTTSIWLVLSITACQTQTANQISQPTQKRLTPKTTTAKTLTAQDLMKNAMLQRFSQSYDYEKTTNYQVDVLYNQQDIESQDASVFLTAIQAFSVKKGYDDDSRYDSRPERKACEVDFSKSYSQTIQQANPKTAKKSSDNSETVTTKSTQQINQELETVYQNYEQCLATLPPLPKKVSRDESDERTIDELLADMSNNASTVDIDDQIPTGETPSKQILTNNSKIVYQNSVENVNKNSNSEYTTIENIVENQPSVYQMSLQKAIDKLKELDNNNKNWRPIDENDETQSTSETGITSKVNKDNLAKMLFNLRLTPAQIDVINQAYLLPQTIKYQGSYNHQTGQFSTVVEENTETPYTQAYKRVPMLIDINEMSVIFEPDVALPLVSFMVDKPLPDLAGKSVKFTLPADLRQNIPLTLLKDSLIQAIRKAYADLDGEKFDELVLDDYGKSIHASRLVKVSLNSNDIGFVVGRVVKYFASHLQQIREQHPEYISDDKNFNLTLDFLINLNKVYRAEDLAKLAQLVETVSPLSFNNFNYYYFDNKNQLIAYRKINDYRSGLFNAKAQSITLNRLQYRETPTKQHYYQPNPADIVDGNALLENYYQDKKLRGQAQDARFGYAYELADNETENEIDSVFAPVPVNY
ncbi:hypothetical protein [Moraxella boevrei]|uniref:hypothetical protein n=1 Tax=Faucicola boevrei TaxID=346665 RepID=UPI0037356F4E